MLTGNVSGNKPKIHSRAKIPGIAETARRMGRTEGHVYLVLSGKRVLDCAPEYRRVHAEVLRDAGFVPSKPLSRNSKNKKASSGTNR